MVSKGLRIIHSNLLGENDFQCLRQLCPKTAGETASQDVYKYEFALVATKMANQRHEGKTRQSSSLPGTNSQPPEKRDVSPISTSPRPIGRIKQRRSLKWALLTNKPLQAAHLEQIPGSQEN